MLILEIAAGIVLAFFFIILLPQLLKLINFLLIAGVILLLVYAVGNVLGRELTGYAFFAVAIAFCAKKLWEQHKRVRLPRMPDWRGFLSDLRE